MNNKYTTIRINEETLETIKTYSEAENKSMTDFLNNLLSDALSEYFLKRSGGAVMTIPNPQIEVFNSNDYKEALNILSDAVSKIDSLDVHITPLLYNILMFFNQRLFYELPEDAEKFKSNMIVDSTQCDSIAKNTNVNSVGKE